MKTRVAAREITLTGVPVLAPKPVHQEISRSAVSAVATSNSQRMLFSPQNMKEFQPDAHGHVFHGSCQQLAMLGGLHAVDPAGWPMDGATLGSIVHWTIDHGLASSSGASAPRAARAFFTAHGIAYQDYSTSQLDAVLATYGGRYPIIIEVSKAYNLPGDEKGVQNHYICVVGYDTAAHVASCVDGDNIVVRRSPDGYGPLCNYSVQTLHAAAPINLMLVRKAHMITLDDPDVKKYFGLASDGKSWYCLKTNHGIQAGSMLDFYRTMPNDKGGLHDLGLPLTAEIPVAGTNAKVQVFERGAMCYDPQRQVDDPPGVDGDVYLAHVDQGVAHDWLKSH